LAGVVPTLKMAPNGLRRPATELPHTERLQGYCTRVLRSASRVCLRFHQPESFTQLLQYLLVDTADPLMARQAILQVGSDFFRAVRKFGLVPSFHPAIRRLSESAMLGSPESLSAAMGWFVLGNDTVGTHLLDAARERLFVLGVPKLRERTALALQYAAALGYAPQPIALGRLEELILRLDPLEPRGATNRYFTLQPLILVDTLVNAVIGDDLELGPAVRRWLDDEEFLIRRRITRDLTEQLAGNSHGSGFSHGKGIVP
ncbi:MAG: hypothetical protein LC104_16310, partial [Bacteroidales bacterium]|nr:hypothetical protein [Bacteroidales bacterium]